MPCPGGRKVRNGTRRVANPAKKHHNGQSGFIEIGDEWYSHKNIIDDRVLKLNPQKPFKVKTVK